MDTVARGRTAIGKVVRAGRKPQKILQDESPLTQRQEGITLTQCVVLYTVAIYLM